MPYSLFYLSRPYRLISYGVSPYTEMARWVLDRLGVRYIEESHVPMLHVLLVRKDDLLPGLVLPQTLLANAQEVLVYWDAHSPSGERLIPAANSDILALIDRFYSKTGIAVRRCAYYYALPNRRATLRCWQEGAPGWEKLVSSLLFPIMRLVIRRGLKLTPTGQLQAMAEIDDCFAMIGQRLSDGRRYLLGDHLTAADIVFASLVGPVIVPPHYGSPLPTLEESPEVMRQYVLRLRATVAGRFVLRLYEEDRGTPSLDGINPAFSIGAFWRQVKNAIAGSPSVLRCVFWLLRRFRPVLLAGGSVVVSRHTDIVDVLGRDTEFTIAEINGKRMSDAYCPFILGWDRSSQYEREAGILRRLMVSQDLPVIGSLTAAHAQECIDVARADGRIDLVNGLARVVATRLVADFFGVPGHREQTMMRWMRILFYELFLNRSNDTEVSRVAADYATKLRDYLTTLIAQRKTTLGAGGDDLLTRLLRLQTQPGDSLDDDGIRRNMSGLIVGAVDTTSAAVVQALDQLLDRPRELALAHAAARNDDVETVGKYVFEALRFNPQTAGLLRCARNGATVAAGTLRETKIPPNSTVVLATLSGMFDSEAVARPRSFRFDREWPLYLHFGHGMHQCYGLHINRVQIPQIAATLLKLEGLRRASGFAGRLAYDGPFPDRLVVEFNS